ncbi:MAG: iron transporter [Lachnospiraceae bacterium]|nr:iron transporter [Lachnospiraceae bacterium]
MKKKIITMMCMLCFCGALLTGCGNTELWGVTFVTSDTKDGAGDVSDKETDADQEAAAPQLEDGVYTAEFTTDSSMFHVNEACDGKGKLTVTDGKMVIHISLTSKNIVNLYPGLAEDAQKDGAELLQPTVDTVTYSDGLSEDVNGFDVPVPALDEEFDLALIGTKGKWYDHKVSVTNPMPADDIEETPDQSQDDAQDQKEDNAQKTDISSLADGSYTAELTFEGGSGKAQILSPALITAENGKVTATVEWSSPNYDYMIVDGEKYLPVNTEGNSVFEIPVAVFDEPITVIGDTVAMSKPHEVEYTITFHTESLYPEE